MAEPAGRPVRERAGGVFPLAAAGAFTAYGQHQTSAASRGRGERLPMRPYLKVLVIVTALVTARLSAGSAGPVTVNTRRS